MFESVMVEFASAMVEFESEMVEFESEMGEIEFEFEMLEFTRTELFCVWLVMTTSGGRQDVSSSQNFGKL